jgi:nucleotide-binding universal stress UspA family protein
MAGILCAVRGGPASKPTIAQAIALAVETKLPLHFLFVVNLDFLTHTTSSRTHTVSEQMDQMGEFILLAAKESAAEQGIKAVGEIRHGNVMEQITQFCHEIEADYLVLGRPRTERAVNVFTHELLAEFIARIEEQTGAKVIMPPEQSNE